MFKAAEIAGQQRVGAGRRDVVALFCATIALEIRRI
jgi:hypothetical protein